MAARNAVFQEYVLGTFSASDTESLKQLLFSNHIRIGNRFYLNPDSESRLFADNNQFVVADIHKIYNTGERMGTSFYNSIGGTSIVLVPRDHIRYKSDIVLPGRDSTDANKCKMNSTNTTGVSQNPLNPLYATTQGQEMAGYQGYYGSDMNQIIIPQIYEDLYPFFKDYIKTNLSYILSDTVDLTAPSFNSESIGRCSGSSYKILNGIVLPSEQEVFGYSIFTSNPSLECTSPSKLALFNFLSTGHYNGWATFNMRNIASSTQFTDCYFGKSRAYQATGDIHIYVLLYIYHIVLFLQHNIFVN